MFRKLDKNGDGRLCKSEIKDGLESEYGSPISKEDVDSIYEAVDTDFSNYIEFTEFVVAACEQKILKSN